MKNDAQHPHLKESRVLISTNNLHVVASKRLRSHRLFLMARLTSIDEFVLLEQLASLCSDEWSMRKNHYAVSITKLNQTR